LKIELIEPVFDGVGELLQFLQAVQIVILLGVGAFVVEPGLVRLQLL